MPHVPKGHSGVRIRIPSVLRLAPSRRYAVDIYKGQIGSCANVVDSHSGEHVKSFSTREHGAMWLTLANAYANELNKLHDEGKLDK